ncbi:triad nucleotide-binding protein 3 [Seminavis robusta]|uniref:Triad nucleotide-binding protein 3 n=1 Tax=Seminavis robusta TaxID=568900 RepID=A0A9N8F1G8_9STRA|nr:triad nucleotide-binding protein 3 [Seminavis robusta]|eukprot:Sro2520_g330180.1 triad nucleotide-binding protein 3 (219) ;mRNA; r:11828-12484
MDSNHKSLPDGTCEYHRPPADDSNSDSQSYYDKHDTVFGRILRGELPAITLAESTRLLAIQDLKPRAPLHALIIPKGFVGSVFDVTGDDQEWMEEMKSMALDLVQAQHPQAFAKGDYRLCFHIPPFNSVNHLHLHVLAPASTMGIYYKYVKYLPGTRWCIEMDEVMTRLQQHMSPVPYQRPPMCPPQTQDMTAAAATTIPNQAKSSSCQSEEKEKDSC